VYVCTCLYSQACCRLLVGTAMWILQLASEAVIEIYLVSVFCLVSYSASAFSALTLLVGRQEEHPACKN